MAKTTFEAIGSQLIGSLKDLNQELPLPIKQILILAK